LKFVICSDTLMFRQPAAEPMGTDPKTRSLRWWIGTAIYGVAMLALAISLAWVVGLAVVATTAPNPEAAVDLAAVSLLTLYVSVLAFPIAMLVQPHKGRALWFAALAGVYVVMFLADVAMGFHMPFWPRFMRGGA
jgi:hypothetical protein